MAFFGKYDKPVLLLVAKELGLSVGDSSTIKAIKQAILKDKEYNEDFTINLLQSTYDREREREREQKQLAIEQKLLEREREQKQIEMNFELEKLKLSAAGPSKERHSVNVDLNKVMNKYQKGSDMSLYLNLFEKQATCFNVHQDHWGVYLLGLLPSDLAQQITRDCESHQYDEIKEVLLKKFQMSAEKFRILFFSCKKSE